MSNPVLDEKKILEINSQLIKLGKKRGYLTYDEINNSFEQVQLDPEMISSFLDLYDSEGISIVKSEKIVETPEVGETEEEDTVLLLPDFDADEDEDNIPANFSTEDEVDLEEKFDEFEFTSQFKINDPVRMYLKEIGRVELLS
ncbi:RNA polymerase subunit sigma, partial [Turicibacter sanguinis]|nr:RNA polymerase subunit sigma [Turicibacter sanguinis]